MISICQEHVHFRSGVWRKVSNTVNSGDECHCCVNGDLAMDQESVVNENNDDDSSI